ncbi:MAG: hypothetical protein KC731_22840, partial [Myxococcales bacterium]|nr:hypothetical protein [Myxococcales bacterium]
MPGTMGLEAPVEATVAWVGDLVELHGGEEGIGPLRLPVRIAWIGADRGEDDGSREAIQLERRHSPVSTPDVSAIGALDRVVLARVRREHAVLANVFDLREPDVFRLRGLFTEAGNVVAACLSIQLRL